MGTSISVFANTFMWKRTEHLIVSPPKEMIYLGRYIDDIIGLWSGNKSEITKVLENVIGRCINLTCVIGGEKI